MSKKNRKQSRGWLLTIPAEKVSRAEINKALGSYAGVIGQLEEGHGGYQHWQTYVEHRTPIAFETLKKKIPQAHIEPRHGTKLQAWEYCTKEDTRVPGELPIKIGDIEIGDNQGKRSDIHVILELVDKGLSEEEILKEVPSASRYLLMMDRAISRRQSKEFGQQIRDIEVQYWFGDTGLGKTSLAWDDYHDQGLYFVNSGDKHPWDSYDPEVHKVVVFDEFSSQIPLPTMLRYLDRFPVQLQARYSNKFAGYKTVILISNLAPKEQYCHADKSQLAAFFRRLSLVREFISKGEFVDYSDYNFSSDVLSSGL